MTGGVKKIIKINLLLVLLVIAIGVAPLVLHRGGGFEGADQEAGKVIVEVNPDYRPWFKPVWEPPSGEVESLIFALQAAIGSGFIGYYFGYVRGSRNRQQGKG